MKREEGAVDRFLKLWRMITERAGPSSEEEAERSESFAVLVGKPVLDPDGTRIGHVAHASADALGGAWLDVTAEWGALDWLAGMGSARHPHFTIHSDDVEEEAGRLRLRRALESYRAA